MFEGARTRIAKMCFHNLLRRKTRTLLCVLGIASAIMVIVVVEATTSRYVEVLRDMNLFFQGDVVVVAKGVIVIQVFPIGGALQESTLEELQRIEEIQKATPLLFIPNPSQSEGAFQLVPQNITIGVPLEDRSTLVGPSSLKAGGRWPLTDLSPEVVVGLSLSDQYHLTVGSVINVRNQNLTVTGILETRSALLMRTIIMSLKLAQKVYGYNMLVNMIVVKPKVETSTESLAEKIEREIDGVKALTESERNELFQPLVYEVESWILGLRTALSLLSVMLIAAVAMMNMFERRRDFATLYAIGASRLSITRIIITETTLLGLFGAVLGLVLGAVASILVVSFYTTLPLYLVFPDLFVLIPPLLMVETLVSTVALGSLAGVVVVVGVGRSRLGEMLRYEY